MTPPPRPLRAGPHEVVLGERPWVMGIVNASPESFSDGAGVAGVEERAAFARRLVDEGADVLDVGGESAITNRPPLDPAAEIARVVPVVEAVSAMGALVSVDTYKPAVAEAAVAAGAVVVNDVSGLRDPELADVCAATGAALVLMHTRAAPKQRLQDPSRYDDVVADVAGFLEERIAVALERGVAPEQLIVDPGPDFAKTPAQTLTVLRRLDELHRLGRPVLLAASRKDFVGALTGRSPRERGAGTLAAVAHGLDAGVHLLRVHDVAATRDFLAVRAALRAGEPVDPGLALPEALRHEPPDPRVQSRP